MSAVIGGTASVLGGGSFENGAKTAAFGYLFNYCAHTRECWQQSIEQVGSYIKGIFSRPNATVGVQGSVGGSAQAIFIGGSYSEGVSVDSNKQVCQAAQACLRLGPGVFVGGGAQGQVSIKPGTALSTTGDITGYIGVGADVGLGVKGAGGQLLIGTDRSLNAATGIPGGGAAAGISAGLDICVQAVRKCNTD